MARGGGLLIRCAVLGGGTVHSTVELGEHRPHTGGVRLGVRRHRDLLPPLGGGRVGRQLRHGYADRQAGVAGTGGDLGALRGDRGTRAVGRAGSGPPTCTVAGALPARTEHIFRASRRRGRRRYGGRRWFGGRGADRRHLARRLGDIQLDSGGARGDGYRAAYRLGEPAEPGWLGRFQGPRALGARSVRRYGREQLTVTTLSGGENAVAFSSSSASRCTRSETAWPTTYTSWVTSCWMRWYSSISAIAASTTWDSGTGSGQRRLASPPARTSRFSSLRRMRVARWSSLNRTASWSGSVSPASSPSSSSSCRSTRLWLRRARLTNIALTARRIRACSAARRTALWCTATNACATSPISSSLPTAVVGISPGSARSLVRSRSIASGNRFWATSSASTRNVRSVRAIDRPIAHEVSSATTRMSRTTPVTATVRSHWTLLRESAKRTASSARPCSTRRMRSRCVVLANHHCCGSTPIFGLRARCTAVSSRRPAVRTAWPCTTSSKAATWLGLASARNRSKAEPRLARVLMKSSKSVSANRSARNTAYSRPRTCELSSLAAARSAKERTAWVSRSSSMKAEGCGSSASSPLMQSVYTSKAAHCRSQPSLMPVRARVTPSMPAIARWYAARTAASRSNGLAARRRSSAALSTACRSAASSLATRCGSTVPRSPPTPTVASSPAMWSRSRWSSWTRAVTWRASLTWRPNCSRLIACWTEEYVWNPAMATNATAGIINTAASFVRTRQCCTRKRGRRRRRYPGSAPRVLWWLTVLGDGVEAVADTVVEPLLSVADPGQAPGVNQTSTGGPVNAPIWWHTSYTHQKVTGLDVSHPERKDTGPCWLIPAVGS